MGGMHSMAVRVQRRPRASRVSATRSMCARSRAATVLLPFRIPRSTPMSASSEVSRRGFLRNTAVGAAGVAVPYFVSAAALGKEDRPAASERIRRGADRLRQHGAGEPGRLRRAARRRGHGRVRRLEAATRSGRRPTQGDRQSVPRLPRDARPEGRRRRDHRHAAALALPHGGRCVRGGQGHLPAKTDDAPSGRKPGRAETPSRSTTASARSARRFMPARTTAAWSSGSAPASWGRSAWPAPSTS